MTTEPWIWPGAAARALRGDPRRSPGVGFFEALTENYLVPGGKPLHYLDRIRGDYPIVLHGVSLSIGSTAPLDREYLRRCRRWPRRIEPAWISDHLCWTGVDGVNLHDLMPMPYTEEALAHLVPTGAARCRTCSGGGCCSRTSRATWATRSSR